MQKHEVLCFIFLSVLVQGFGKIVFNTYPNMATGRSTIYHPRVIDKVCYLKPDDGPCRSNIKMWYFDASKMDCSRFYWGGCQGNGNRFDTRKQCISTCVSVPNPPKVRPKWCSLTFDYGFCFGAIKRWYYDPIWKVCKETIYSGCGGNKNNFANKELCNTYCIYGVGSLTTSTPSFDSLKKIVVVLPFYAPVKKSRHQTLPPQPPAPESDDNKPPCDKTK